MKNFALQNSSLRKAIFMLRVRGWHLCHFFVTEQRNGERKSAKGYRLWKPLPCRSSRIRRRKTSSIFLHLSPYSHHERQVEIAKQFCFLWNVENGSGYRGASPYEGSDKLLRRMPLFFQKFLGVWGLFSKRPHVVPLDFPFFIPSTPCRSVGSAGRPRQGRRHYRRPRGRGERCRDHGGRGRRIQRWFSSSCQWYAEPWRWSAWA